MKTNLKTSFAVLYLPLLQILASITVLSGCAPAPPVITFAPADQAGPPLKTPDQALKVANFSTSAPQYQHYGNYVRDYLKQQLAAKRSSQAKPSATADPTAADYLLLTGNVALMKTVDPVDSGKIVQKVEVTFEILNSKGDTLFHSVSSKLAATAETENLNLPPAQVPDPVEEVLRQAVDSFVARLYPAPEMTYSMARGRSKFDRQGRNCVAEGDYDAALLFFRRAIDHRPDDHAALYNAGLVSEALGNYRRALDYYRRAQQLRREDEDYKIAADRIQRLLNGK